MLRALSESGRVELRLRPEDNATPRRAAKARFTPPSTAATPIAAFASRSLVLPLAVAADALRRGS